MQNSFKCHQHIDRPLDEDDDGDDDKDDDDDGAVARIEEPREPVTVCVCSTAAAPLDTLAAH